MLKRFLIFTETGETLGGFKDFHSAHDRAADAVAAAPDPRFEWSHVVDQDGGDIIWDCGVFK